MVEAEPSTEDLHGLVLAQAFQGLLASPSRLQCFTADHRLLSLNRAVLLLFSPFLRSALASVPAPAPATLLLPGVEASTLMRLEDLLATGTADSFREIGQSRLVMEAAALLGLPVQALQLGGDHGPSVKLNVSASLDPSVRAMFHTERRKGKRILLVSEDLGMKARPEVVRGAEKSEEKPSKKHSNEAPTAPVHIKKEVEPPTEQAEETEEAAKEPSSVSEPGGTQQTDSEDLKNKCEKCTKGFPSLTLLRYHYCSHFRGLLKKRFSSLFEDNKCLSCGKTFANSGRLLLHIGVQHDKINEILRLKGLTVLPPWTTSSATEEGGSTQPAPKQEPVDREPAPGPVSSAPPLPRIATPPLVTSPAPPCPVAPSQSGLTTPLPSPGPAPALPATVTPPSEAAPRPDATPCNYDLECEVCSQKQRSIQLLEQHCCRHFMKELQEQYASLMDGLKCTVCNNVFKQKHSLLLHIGCKHGKVNEVLKQKGFAALPCPVNATSSAAMQKQLIQIKKERMEVKDEVPPRSGGAKESSSSQAAAVEQAEKPSSLDDILRKYKFTTGAGGQIKKI